MSKPTVILSILLGLFVANTIPGLSAAQFPAAGDDVTSSLGQFKIVVDSHWEAAIEANPAYKPYLKNSGGHLSLTSPVLFDPVTTIGRSDPLLSGSAEDINGVIAGTIEPNKIKETDFALKPVGFEGPSGTREVHTFIQSLHLSGSGFEVKAGRQAPLRPMCPGEVESLSNNSSDPNQDFPAKSFFNVFVEVNIPGLGGFPNIQLVNVEPLLVQSTNINSFPPTVVYIHDNSSAVSMYFNADIPQFGIKRGDLFGQLTLAGHGVGKRESEAEEFQQEVETETELPLKSNPVEHVSIIDHRIFQLEFARVGTTNIITFPADARETYSLDFAPFLSNTTPWTGISTHSAAADQTFSIEDVRTAPFGFYRVHKL
jgi:hypothetical protein